MSAPTLLALAARWRQDAELLRSYGHAETAQSCERHADQLEAAVREAQDEALTLAQAAEESGYSTRRLRELVSEGRIPNAGRRNAPRIRRGDVPMKPGKDTGTDALGGYDPEADAAELRVGLVR